MNDSGTYYEKEASNLLVEIEDVLILINDSSKAMWREPQDKEYCKLVLAKINEFLNEINQLILCSEEKVNEKLSKYKSNKEKIKNLCQENSNLICDNQKLQEEVYRLEEKLSGIPPTMLELRREASPYCSKFIEVHPTVVDMSPAEVTLESKHSFLSQKSPDLEWPLQELMDNFMNRENLEFTHADKVEELLNSVNGIEQNIKNLDHIRDSVTATSQQIENISTKINQIVDKEISSRKTKLTTFIENECKALSTRYSNLKSIQDSLFLLCRSVRASGLEFDSPEQFSEIILESLSRIFPLEQKQVIFETQVQEKSDIILELSNQIKTLFQIIEKLTIKINEMENKIKEILCKRSKLEIFVENMSPYKPKKSQASRNFFSSKSSKTMKWAKDRDTEGLSSLSFLMQTMPTI